jgi:hypothetical protein
MGPFVPEYILPQILLQWVIQQPNLDGIRYFSARSPSKGLQFLGHSNSVFPVREVAPEGQCAYLKEKFTLTEPILWELLTATNLGSRTIAGDPPNAFAWIQVNTDLPLAYSQTAFSDVESKLA